MSGIPPDILKPLRTEERIARRIARAGICSRREAEQLILEGLVTVNGQTLESPALTVKSKDVITVRGAEIPSPKPAQLWLYYKPRGLVVSNKDDKGRKTVFSALPSHLPRVISVGRLDINSEGLLLLTNDGALSRHLELPSTGWIRKYKVRVRGIVDTEKLGALADGVIIDGIHYGSARADLDSQMTSNAWLTVAIREGKNREVRHLMDYLGYPVSRLIRLSFGPFQLGKLSEGEVVEVKPAVLSKQLGLTGKSNNPSKNAPRHSTRRSHNNAASDARKLARFERQQDRLQKSRRAHPRNIRTK